MKLVILIFLVLIVISIFTIWGFWPLKFAKRRILSRRRFPDSWRHILARNAPFYPRLPDQLKKRLHERMLIFISEKNFEGCAGVKVTEEMKVTIAAFASLIALGLDRWDYPWLDSILIYPSSYVVPDAEDMDNIIIEGKSEMLGESWQHGTIVLAWDEVLKSAKNTKDRANLVIHEFAHQLDVEDALADGIPILKDFKSYNQFVSVVGKEYSKHRSRVERNAATLIDEYGAEDPPEFFATASELFFEDPKLFKNRMPELYGVLADFYRLDPAKW